LLGVLALAAISFWWAPYPLLAVVTFGHLFVAFLLLYMLAREFRDRRFFAQAAWVLTTSVTVQAVWAIAQFTANHDFGAQLIGESVLRPDLHGVAKIVYYGQQHIRAYGTFPHPNLFAAYLAAAIFAVGTVIFWPSKRSRATLWNVLAGVLLGLLGATLILTFSRVALILVVVNGLLVILFSLRKWRRLPPAAGIAAVLFVLTAAVCWQPLVGRTTLESPQETGVSNRTVGYEIARDAIEGRALGVGAGNFVPAIDELRVDVPDYQHQPAHNTLLLLTAELGFLGGLLAVWFLVRTGWLFHRLQPRDRRINTINFSLFMLAGTLVGISLVDHFFWSLPQGLWLVMIVLAAIISRIPEPTFEDHPAPRR
jgi:O-antigen ligase